MECQIQPEVLHTKGSLGERRGSTRFPLNFEIRYSVLDHPGPFETGAGVTTDMSSSGLSFTADRPLAAGYRLSISIDWPALLDGGVQLQLVVNGVVVRSAGTLTALRIERHEFKTRRIGVKVLRSQA